MASDKQIQANRSNAKLSTGPRTEIGKLAVSGNRLTHGILSTKLLLTGESPEDYRALLDGVVADLQPVGLLEMSLVEKVSVLIWRQRRLTAAETSTIELATNPKKLFEELCGGLGIPDYGSQALSTSDMAPPDPEQQAWCRDVLVEYSANEGVELGEMKDKCPLIYQQLTGDAGREGAIKKYIEEYCEYGLGGYIRELVIWCRRQIENAERYPEVIRLTEHANRKLRVPWGRLELLSKYQVSLDNQLYKALKALRDAQEWRFKTQVPESESSPKGKNDTQVA